MEDLDNMKKEQNNKCLICEREDKLVVDHNHDSGEVRGLLCSHCNKLLGCARENTQTLKNAISYLNSFEKEL